MKFEKQIREAVIERCSVKRMFLEIQKAIASSWKIFVKGFIFSKVAGF